jgi:hypothetical protein
MGVSCTSADGGERTLGGHRIRHYGLLASGVKADNLALARKLLDVFRARFLVLIHRPLTTLAPAEPAGSQETVRADAPIHASIRQCAPIAP